MVIHFICEGNIYRSRIAEAYLNSLKIPGVKVISSGTHAAKDEFGSISRYAKILLTDHKLITYAVKHWTQLNQKLIDQSDVVICVNREVYHQCRQAFKLPMRTFIWDIADIKKLLPSYERLLQQNRVPVIAQTTFRKIIKHVDELIALIKRPKPRELVDVLNFDGQPLGKTADIDEIHSRGLWHNGVHAALYTKDGQAVLEKRSESIIYNPGLWDLTLGGVVAAGETPEAAVIRETAEEIGVILRPNQLKKIMIYRYDHYLPHYGLHNRVVNHVYLAEISPPKSFKLQNSEVAEVQLLPLPEARQMVMGSRSDLGEMSHYRHFNRRLIDALQKELAARS